MKILLLPGNSPDHKIWIREIEALLHTYFEETSVIEYENWTRGGTVDIEEEIEKIRKITSSWDNYCIFAKSVGTAIAAKCIKSNILHPKKCVFVGTPVLWTRQNEIDLDTWIQDYSIPTLFIQQTLDPCMPSKELKDFLVDSRVSNHSYIEVAGDDHKYTDTKQLAELSKEFYF